MLKVKIEQINGKIYIRCPICGNVLVTNDQSYSLQKIKHNELTSISSCDHFLIIDVHKDSKSILKEEQNIKNAILLIENKKYITVVVPRKL